MFEPLHVTQSRKNGYLVTANRRSKREILLKVIAPEIHSLIEQAEIKRVMYAAHDISWDGCIPIETQLERVDLDIDQIVTSVDWQDLI